MRALEGEDGTVLTHGTMYDNPALAPSAVEALERRYGGTRLGRQELLGEYIEEIEGALWIPDWIDNNRRSELPYIEENGIKRLDLPRVVVAVDPAVTANAESDETGLAVAGLGADGDYYLMSASGYRLPPHQWAMKVLEAYDHWQADKIVCEVNNGGDMVVETINRVCEGLGRSVNVESIRASRGKTLRAEPIAALYEQGRVHHVGIFNEAEDQLCSFPVAAEHDDMVDAIVYALSDLSNEGQPNVRFL